MNIGTVTCYPLVVEGGVSGTACYCDGAGSLQSRNYSFVFAPGDLEFSQEPQDAYVDATEQTGHQDRFCNSSAHFYPLRCGHGIEVSHINSPACPPAAPKARGRTARRILLLILTFLMTRFRLFFFDLRRCSTADQSGLSDF